MWPEHVEDPDSLERLIPVLQLVGNVASGALETRGYDRLTLELIAHVVWTTLPVELRQPVVADNHLLREIVDATRSLPPPRVRSHRAPPRIAGEPSAGVVGP